MANFYHCNTCRRDIIAPTRNKVLEKVQVHNLQKHQISEHSGTHLHAIRRRIESYMEKGYLEN